MILRPNCGSSASTRNVIKILLPRNRRSLKAPAARMNHFYETTAESDDDSAADVGNPKIHPSYGLEILDVG